MYTKILFEDKGEKQKWLGSSDIFKQTYPKATIIKKVEVYEITRK